MKTNTKFLSLGLAVAAVVGGIGTAAAFGGGMRGNFDHLTEAQQAQIEAAGNDRDQIREIMDGIREERQADREAEHAAVKAAIEANDYSAFKDAVSENSPFADITEDQFPLVRELHDLHQREEEIWKELGTERPEGRCPGGHKGHGEGRGGMMGEMMRGQHHDAQ